MFHLEYRGRRRPPKPGGDDGRPLPFVWKIQPCVVTIQMTILSVAHNRLPRRTASASGPKQGRPSAPTNRPRFAPVQPAVDPRRNGAGRRRRERRKKPGRNRRDPPRITALTSAPPRRGSQPPTRSVSGPLATAPRWATTGGRRFLSKPHCELSWILCRPGDPPGRNPPVVLSQKSEKSPIETSSMTAHRGAVTGPSNHWNSVVEVRASKHNSMAVSTDHHPPCSGPRRDLDSPRGVTNLPGCEMAADLREVGCNSTAELSGRTQPTDRVDHRPVGTKRISFQRQLSSLVSWPIHRLRENPPGRKVVGHPTSCGCPRWAGRHHPNPPPHITGGQQIAKPLTHHSKGDNSP